MLSVVVPVVGKVTGDTLVSSVEGSSLGAYTRLFFLTPNEALVTVLMLIDSDHGSVTHDRSHHSSIGLVADTLVGVVFVCLIALAYKAGSLHIRPVLGKNTLHTVHSVIEGVPSGTHALV